MKSQTVTQLPTQQSLTIQQSSLTIQQLLTTTQQITTQQITTQQTIKMLLLQFVVMALQYKMLKSVMMVIWTTMMDVIQTVKFNPISHVLSQTHQKSPYVSTQNQSK